jgi:hypothetical protein
MPCRSSCPTQDHGSWGACARSARLQIGTIQNRPHAKAWDAEIAAYKDARRQGVQPAGTTMKQTTEAMEISQRTGKAFQADDVIGSLS